MYVVYIHACTHINTLLSAFKVVNLHIMFKWAKIFIEILL